MIERRAHLPELVELRAQTENDKPVLLGYAARYNSLSVPLDEGQGEFRERLLPGAFTRTLSEGPDVIALAHHDASLVLGRRSAGTLKLTEDEQGLRVMIYPPDNTLGRDITESIRRGDLVSMSFGFEVVDDEVRKECDGVVRDVRDLVLHEVSVVAWPAYEATSIKVRSDVRERVTALRAPARVPMTVRRLQQQHAQRSLHG